MQWLASIVCAAVLIAGISNTTAASRKKHQSSKKRASKTYSSRTQSSRVRASVSREGNDRSSGQTTLSPNATRKDLQRLRSSIESTRKRIDALQRRESSTMRSLSSVQRQRQQVSAIVRDLEVELHALQDSVTVLEHHIRTTTSARQRTEAAYNDLAFAAIARRSERGDEEYSDRFLLKYATEQMQQHRYRMRNRQDSLSMQHSMLASTSTEHEGRLRERAAEGRRLASTVSARTAELERIRGDKSLLLKELASKRSSANTLSNMIRRQEEISRQQEAKRQKDATARRQAQASTRVNKGIGSSSPSHKNAGRNDDGSERGPARGAGSTERGPAPGAGRGFGANSLPWPTQSRSLIHGYGTYRNRETGTTMDNPGLDIRSPIGARMTCVASGVVSSVTWLPGFGSLVIVDHQNGFRTVYANLTSTNVAVGSSVQAGTVIGTSGESIDGPTAHFEVWRGREKQNPLTYLR